MLDRIEVNDFRGFCHLQLDGLHRVSLIVGKNNSGKTTLLEALAILFDPSYAIRVFSELRSMESGLLQLFRKNQFGKWVIRQSGNVTRAHITGYSKGKANSVVIEPLPGNPKHFQCRTKENDKPIQQKPPVQSPRKATRQREDESVAAEHSSVCVIGSTHRDPSSLVKLFGKALLRRNGEESIERVVRTVDKRIRKIRIDPSSNENRVVVDIGLESLVPLSQLGQGIARLVEILSEIVGAGASACIIDEIENGIHHSSLIDVWRGLASAAAECGVQVFATTHSHECIEAAHQAFIERQNYDLSVIQLFRESEQQQGRVLDREHIAAGIAGNIDLRG
jgi:predicted ATP-dependent endonuclease of OLD family